MYVLQVVHKFGRSDRPNVKFEILSDQHSSKETIEGLSFCILSLQCAQNTHSKSCVHVCTYVLACVCVCVCEEHLASQRSAAHEPMSVYVYRLWTWANQQNSNSVPRPPALPSQQPTATSPCCRGCRKLRPCHAFASIHYPLVAEWPDNSVWRFGSLQICRVRMLSQMFGVPKCTRCTLARRESWKLGTGHRAPGTGSWAFCTLFCRTSKHLVRLGNKWLCWFQHSAAPFLHARLPRSFFFFLFCPLFFGVVTGWLCRPHTASQILLYACLHSYPLKYFKNVPRCTNVVLPNEKILCFNVLKEHDFRAQINFNAN